MSDSIEVTRLIFSCEEVVLSEGLVFFLRGLYGNLIIWKYYWFMDFLQIVVIIFCTPIKPLPHTEQETHHW